MSNNNRNQPVNPPLIPPQARKGMQKLASLNPGLPIPTFEDDDPVMSPGAIARDAGIDTLELASQKEPQLMGGESLEDLQKMLLLAQLRSANLTIAREERDEAKRSEFERVQKAARDNNIAAIRKLINEKEAAREGCPHQKPNNRGSAIAGTRDHQGHYHFLCQYCQREWTDNQLPPHLRIDSDFIGGPTIGALVF